MFSTHHGSSVGSQQTRHTLQVKHMALSSPVEAGCGTTGGINRAYKHFHSYSPHWILSLYSRCKNMKNISSIDTTLLYIIMVVFNGNSNIYCSFAQTLMTLCIAYYSFSMLAWHQSTSFNKNCLHGYTLLYVVMFLPLTVQSYSDLQHQHALLCRQIVPWLHANIVNMHESKLIICLQTNVLLWDLSEPTWW